MEDWVRRKKSDRIFGSDLDPGFQRRVMIVARQGRRSQILLCNRTPGRWNAKKGPPPVTEDLFREWPLSASMR